MDKWRKEVLEQILNISKLFTLCLIDKWIKYFKYWMLNNKIAIFLKYIAE